MLTKGVAHEENITMTNAYTLNVGVSNFITRIPLYAEASNDLGTIKAHNSNSPYSSKE